VLEHRASLASLYQHLDLDPSDPASTNMSPRWPGPKIQR
jgi:hypothetical protein